MACARRPVRSRYGPQFVLKLANMKKGKLLRMDNITIVVEDMKATIDFFLELGMELEGETTVEGDLVDRVVGMRGVKSDIAVLRTPDGHNRLEVTKFQTPKATTTNTNLPLNTLGIGRIMFAVEDLYEVLARLEAKGAKLVDEVVNYQDQYLLCYLRGPEGILLALAEDISKK
jgi:catechol 2,3-dioxygenase-like lactoylglutathione lyase family enzyme